MARKRRFMTYKESKKRGFFDEYPMLTDDVDPQLHMSCGLGAQPFWLVCEKDSMVALMSGRATIEFKDSPVLYEDMGLGDFVYIPAGTPTRMTNHEETIHYRYKALDAGLEAVAWYCDSCGAALYRETWDTADEVPQKAYLRITEAFNDSEDMRTCKSCGQIHDEVDISDNNWHKISEELS